MICRVCGHADPEALEGGACPVDGHPMLSEGVIARHGRDPLLGTVVGGEFLVLDVLGIGGFGTVYRAS